MSAYDEITVEEAASRLEAFRLVDVRQAHEYRGPLGHIEGAAWVPLGELVARREELPGDRRLLMVCRSGGRSGVACEALAGAGTPGAVNLAGGMIAWNEAGLPIVPMCPATAGELLASVRQWVEQVSPLSGDQAAAIVSERLLAAKVDPKDPTPAGVEPVLAAFEAAIGGENAPADMALCMAAFRRALAML